MPDKVKVVPPGKSLSKSSEESKVKKECGDDVLDNNVPLDEFVRIIYDYESPPGSERFVIRRGELYRLVERSTDEWWYVENEDTFFGCYVPSTFVELISSKEYASQRGAPAVPPLHSLTEEEEEISCSSSNASSHVSTADSLQLPLSDVSVKGRNVKVNENVASGGVRDIRDQFENTNKAAAMSNSPLIAARRPRRSSGNTTDSSCTPDFKETEEAADYSVEEQGGAASSDEGLLSGTDGSSEQLNIAPHNQSSSGMDSQHSEFRQQLTKKLSLYGTTSSGSSLHHSSAAAAAAVEKNSSPSTTLEKSRSGQSALALPKGNSLPHGLRLAEITAEPSSGQPPVSSSKHATNSSNRPHSLAAVGELPDPPPSQPPSGRPEISLPIANLQSTRKEGFLLRTKFAQDGKKVKKRWTQIWAVLTGPSLYLYKDRSASTCKSPVPQETLELATLCISAPEEGLTKRKNVLKLVTEADVVWLIQSEKRCKEWEVALHMAKDLVVRQMYGDAPLSPNKRVSRHSSYNQTQKRGVVKILNDFFKRRPPVETLQAKGILKYEPVFGSTLALIIEQESPSRVTSATAAALRGEAPIDVPLFVYRCIEAVEKRGGLLLEGIYRVAGNAATVQRLRCKVDQTDIYNLNESQWEVHVLTAALKTFFRELKEPLIPFTHYNRLLDAYHENSTKPKAKLDAVRSILESIPHINYQTMKLLFLHIYRVLEHSRVNQMMSHNLATMFGPNIMWSEQPSVDLTTSLLLQNQVTDFIIIETPRIFVK